MALSRGTTAKGVAERRDAGSGLEPSAAARCFTRRQTRQRTAVRLMVARRVAVSQGPGTLHPRLWAPSNLVARYHHRRTRPHVLAVLAVRARLPLHRLPHLYAPLRRCCVLPFLVLRRQLNPIPRTRRESSRLSSPFPRCEVRLDADDDGDDDDDDDDVSFVAASCSRDSRRSGQRRVSPSATIRISKASPSHVVLPRGSSSRKFRAIPALKTRTEHRDAPATDSCRSRATRS